MARYHLDTSFLIDWQRGATQIEAIRDEILTGTHEISIDPIVETEFFAGGTTSRKAELLFQSILRLSQRLDLSSSVSRRAAAWLGPMDKRMRKEHFGDALIGATAVGNRATLVSSDRRIEKVFPDVKTRTY